MPEPLPKPRSSLTTITGTTTNNINNSKAAPWTTTRCHRLLRPLTAKLQALRNIIQNNPSATSANAARPKPKRDLTDPDHDPDALFVEIAEKAAGGRGAGSSGMRIRTKPQRTYGGGNASGARSNGGSSTPALGTTATTSSLGINDYLSIWGDNTAPTAPPHPNPPKKPNRALPHDPYNPLILLHSFRPILHPSIFSVYLGIYTSLESVLFSTNCPPSGPQVPPLRTLAARKIAHCILATSCEIESDDIWYDAAAELGSSGEYLREVVRWHAIELVRDATAEGLMDGRDGGLGMAGVLVGLCRNTGADQEAQSLLQTLFDLHPVISSSDSPAIQALTMFFSETPEVMYRFLTKNFPATSLNPSWLGSTDIHAFLLLASAEIDDNPGIETLASRALEAAFGLWGEEHLLVLSGQRQCTARQRAPRRDAKSLLDTIPDDDETSRKPPASAMPWRIGLKAETIVLKMVKSLLLLSLQNHSSKATLVLRSLVRGFLAQSAAIKTTTEDVWGPRYPVAAKVAILLHGLGTGAEDDLRIFDETARCLEDICGSGGSDGMKSLASFIANCYIPLYRRASKHDEVQVLAARMISLTADPTNVAPRTVPVTPRVSAGRMMVTFTPGKPAMAPAQELRETKRYLLAQLALQIAVGFSLKGKVKSDAAWIEWLRQFERKVIGLKIQTPGRVKAILRQQEVGGEDVEAGGEVKKRSRDKTKRKGWRYEEGLDLWVAVGATPGRERPQKARGVFIACVEVTIDEDYDWRAEYEALDTADEIMVDVDVIDSEPESEASEYIANRRVTPTPTFHSSTSDDDDDDDDDDDEFYSNIRISPPRTLRRSPRNTAKIRKSLASFAVIMSSPVLTRLRTPALKGSGLRKPFDLFTIGSSPMNSSPAVGFWSGSRGSLGVGAGDSSPVVRRNVGREISYMEDEDEDEREQYELEMEDDILTLGPSSMKLSKAYTSPRPPSAHPSSSAASRQKHLSLANLMDSTSSSDAEVQEGGEEGDDDTYMEPSGGETEDDVEAEFSRATANTALPVSSPPPPRPSSFPRRPARISLNAATLRAVTPPVTVLTPRLHSNAAPTPQRKVVEGPKQQRKIEKSAKRRRISRARKRARRMFDDDLSADELGM